MKKALLILGGIVLVAFSGRATWAIIQMNKTVPQIATTVPGTETQVETPQALLGAICTTEDCFKSKFTLCEKSSFQPIVESFGASIYYEIIGSQADGCEMMLKYPTNPNPTWVNQPMTCNFDNKLDFTTSVQKTLTQVAIGGAKCTGPLYGLMRNVGTSKPITNSVAPSQSTNTVVIDRAYVKGADVMIDGQGLWAVTDARIDGDTCIMHLNSEGFKESFGQTNITLGGYARCLPTTRPNYIDLSWNSTSGKKQGRYIINTSSSTATGAFVPVPTVAIVTTGSPTATLLVNGQSNLIVNVGDKTKLVWSSTNGDTFSRADSIAGCNNAMFNTSANSKFIGDANGSGPFAAIGLGPFDVVPTYLSGCVLTSVFTVQNSTNGKQANATAVIKVK